MTKYSLVSTLLVLMTTVTFACHAQGSVALTEAGLIRMTQERMDAIVSGNQRPFERQFAKDALIFDEKGRNMDKATLVKETRPLPKGFSATIKVVNPAIRVAGGTIVFAYDLNETEVIFGQVNRARYHATDTWVDRHGAWKIIAEQVLRYYQDPQMGRADPSKYPEYVGTYRLGPVLRLTVTRDGSHLYYQKSGKKPQELIPETPDIFFTMGVEGRQLFKLNYAGQVVGFIERRNNEDLVWRRLK